MGKYKKIGVLGGMGPGATTDVYAKIISYMQHKYGAVQDNDFPPMAIHNVPLEGFSEIGFVDKDLVREQLIDAVLDLQQSGVSVMGMACNTVHYFFEDLASVLDIRLVNMVEASIVSAHRDHYRCIGIVGSQSTNELGLYDYYAAQHNVAVLKVNKEEQVVLNDIILQVMAGRINSQDTVALKKIIMNMVRRGAQAVVLGCTELPLAICPLDIDIPLIDATQVLARELTRAVVEGES